VSPLERRYRRLLALYPAAHRREYEDEMVTVLLADTAPGRDRPPVATILDLLVGAAAARVRTTRHWLTGDPWRRAAGPGVLVICGLLAARALPVIERALMLRYGPPHWYRDAVVLIVVSLLWPVVAMLAAVGWRRSAVTLAGALTAGMVVNTVAGARWLPELSGGLLVVLGLTATIGCTVRRAPAGRIRARWQVALGALVVLAELIRRPPLLLETQRWPVSQVVLNVGYLVALAATGVLAIVVLVRLGPAVSARIAAMLVPALAARAVVGPVGLAAWTPLGSEPPLLVAAVAAAVTSFGLALVALAALDRVLGWVRLGRAAEAAARRGPAPD
jgi:hypothetical protein